MPGINRKRGQAIIGVILFFLFISSALVLALSRAVYHQLRTSSDMSHSRSSYYLAEALAEDVAYRMIKGYILGSGATLSIGGHTATATIADVVGGKDILAEGNWGGRFRTVKLHVTYGTGGSFFYGVQVGEGGLWMYNTSGVSGNVHSSGPVKGVGNIIRGDALSAGATGIIENVHATSSAYAHTIKDSIVDKDAYYTTLTNTSVGGVQYPNSPDQATTTLPISDEQIDEWETDAAAGGSVTCSGGSYTISSNTTIGPKKIPCDLVISGNPIITIAGALWVTGNITFQNNPVLRITPSYTDVTIPIIADNTSDRLNSSRIILQNSTIFQGSGNNSYVLIVSRNISAQQGGTVDAIVTQNSVDGEVLLYAPYGNVRLQNSVNLREVTSYKLTLENTAEVIYKSGLANVLFTSGPSGGFNIVDWREVQ